MLLQMTLFHSFYDLKKIYISSLSIPLLKFIPCLAIVNSVAINTGIRVSFRIVFSRYMCSSGVAGSYGRFISSFLKHLHTVFHSGCTNSHFRQQRGRARLSPYSLQHLFFVDFLIMTILTGVR